MSVEFFKGEKKKAICEECDVRERCAVALKFDDVGICSMFSSRSGKKVDGVSPEDREQLEDMQLEDGPDEVFRA